MPAADLCTEEEITWMVHAFYGRIRADELLGPVFASRISDWDHHLGKMVDFWSSALRGTARYRGTPMPKHVALPGLDAGMFRHWLELFHQTTRELTNEAMRRRADELAGRIAQSLWYGYQLHRDPQAMPGEIPAEGARHA
jgi:hemoglobin